jgi:hypothetical protein
MRTAHLRLLIAGVAGLAAALFAFAATTPSAPAPSPGVSVYGAEGVPTPPANADHAKTGTPAP